MAGPGDEMAAAQGRIGDLRASHADREQVIGVLKAAYVEGRLTEDELDTRAGQVYASRTYAELAEFVADVPAEPTGAARSARDPWRATKIAWRVVYATIAPGVVTLILLPAGPRTTREEVVVLATVVYVVFWLLGMCIMLGARHVERSAGQLPPRSAPGALAGGACDD